MFTAEYKKAIEIFERYIAAWNHRDADLLANLMDANAFLTDWEISVQGRESVVGANANIWQNVPDVHIHIDTVYYCPNKTTVVAKITVESKKENFSISVVDIVTLKENKIFSVEAYKQ